MRKKILAILLCVFSIFALCGCGSVSYVLKIDTDGSVTQAVNVSFSYKKVTDAGKTIDGNDGLKNHIQTIANNVVNNSVGHFASSHNMTDELKTYDGKTVLFSDIYNYTLSQMNIVRYLYNFEWRYRPNYEWTQDGDNINCTISIKFNTIYAYYYFHNIYPDDEDTSEKIIENHAFYVKTETESESPFYDLKNSEIAQHFVDYFGGVFSLKDMEYNFYYATPNTKLYSDAQNSYTTANGIKVHEWHFTASDLDKEKGGMIHTYQIKVKPYTWYMLAIVISLGVALILTIVVKVKESKNKKVLQTQNQNIDEVDNN